MKDVSNKNDRKFILKNLPELSNELYDFSSYINNLIKLNYSNESDNIKLSKLKNMKYKDYKLNKNEANQILKVLKQFGGESEIKKIINDTIVPEFPNLDTNILNNLSPEPPKNKINLEPSAPPMDNDDTIDFLRDMAHNGISLDDSGIKDIEKYDDYDIDEPGSYSENLETDNGNFKYIDTEIDNRSDEEKVYDNLPDGSYSEPNPENLQEDDNQVIEPNKCRNRGFFECLINDNLMQDYHKRLDWIYIILFVLASVPFIGLLPNVIIIFRALRDGRTFLAIITSLTTALSLLEGHIVDLGLAFKIIYFLDVFTVIKYAKDYAPSWLNLDEPENKGIISTLLEKYGKMLSGFILFSLLTATEYARSITKSYNDNEDNYETKTTINQINNQQTKDEQTKDVQAIDEQINDKQTKDEPTNDKQTNDKQTNDEQTKDEQTNDKQTKDEPIRPSSPLSRPMTAEEFTKEKNKLYNELDKNNINYEKANKEVEKEQKNNFEKKKNERDKKKKESKEGVKK